MIRIKIFKIAFFIIMVLVVLYGGAILAGFNLPRPAFLQPKGIIGEAVLEVKLVMDNTSQDPLGMIEVDLAEKPGPPPEGGRSATDEMGMAVFHVKPGNYFIYFNDSNFPKNLESPAPRSVTVTQEGPNQVTIRVSTAD